METTECSGQAGNADAVRVFYDGDCPMCRREIAFLDKRALPGSLDLVDISKVDAQHQILAPGLDRQQAIGYMHVQLPDGRVVKGAEAFAAMWERVPRAAPLARIASKWPLRPVLNVIYRAFLVVRPSLQALARRAEQRRLP